MKAWKCINAITQPLQAELRKVENAKKAEKASSLPTARASLVLSVPAKQAQFETIAANLCSTRSEEKIAKKAKWRVATIIPRNYR